VVESRSSPLEPVTSQTTDVVIAGSGPTGLMSASLLRRCGVNVRILDKSEQQAHESRAFGVHAKSMELLLSIGLADEFLNRGLIATGVQVFVDGLRVGGFNFDDIGRADTPYSFLLMVPQWDIEAILVEDLRRLGVEVEHNVEVTGFEQSAEGVLVHASDKAGESFEVRCSYLIGADGAHSIVRKTLGLTFEGAPYPQGFLLADCKINWPLDYDHMKLFLRGRDLAFYLPLKGKDVGRIIAIKPVETGKGASIDDEGSSPVSLDTVQEALRDASGMEIELTDPLWTTHYRIHHRGVNKYGEGRVFLAGDAAHIHSPAGAQGMNTGLQDAANLVWKLVLVLRGHAPRALLDTYNSERRPVGQKILNYTDKLFAGMSSQTGWVAGLRNMLVPVLAATLSRSGTVRAKAFHFLSQLGIRYHESDFVHDSASARAPRAWRDGLSAGHRAPNALFGRNRDVFGLIQGYRFHVLLLSREPLTEDEIQSLSAALADLRKAVDIDLETHIIAHSLVGRDERICQAESNQAFEAYGLTDATPRGLFFIRPDGYIAYRSDGFNVKALQEFIQQRFGGGSAA
jgi:2-polyprenyl-6-methoxyphenol hydroxylase-like FAD-dependent oxidoreductase